MKFTKYNNPNRRRKPRRMSRTDADILAAKQMLDDRDAGIELPLVHYDRISDDLCGKESRRIYD